MMDHLRICAHKMYYIITMDAYMNRKSEIGEGLERIRRAMKLRRVALGINQEEAALRAGIAPGTLKRFERTGEISLARLLALM